MAKKDTDELVRELKEVLKDYRIKPIDLAKQIGMTEAIVYRWVKGTSRPTGKTRDKLLQVITLLRTGDFIENLDIEVKSGFEGTLESIILDKVIFEKIKPSLTPEQKAWLLETGDYLIYHTRLQELNDKHRMIKRHGPR